MVSTHARVHVGRNSYGDSDRAVGLFICSWSEAITPNVPTYRQHRPTFILGLLPISRTDDRTTHWYSTTYACCPIIVIMLNRRHSVWYSVSYTALHKVMHEDQVVVHACRWSDDDTTAPRQAGRPAGKKPKLSAVFPKTAPPMPKQIDFRSGGHAREIHILPATSVYLTFFRNFAL